MIWCIFGQTYITAPIANRTTENVSDGIDIWRLCFIQKVFRYHLDIVHACVCHLFAHFCDFIRGGNDSSYAIVNFRSDFSAHFPYHSFNVDSGLCKITNQHELHIEERWPFVWAVSNRMTKQNAIRKFIQQFLHMIVTVSCKWKEFTHVQCHCHRHRTF